MDDICKICGETVIERKHYYSKHKIKEINYHALYNPRYDRLTKELIPFKSPDSYYLTDFVSKINLKKYLESITKEDGLTYCGTWMERRKIAKNLIYAPGEFEIRSLQFPSIRFFHKFFGQGSYENMCLRLGLQLKYDYNDVTEFKHDPKEILVDSREQIPYTKLDLPIRICALNFADYCPNPNPENLFIERKAISDWAGVMSKGYERFNREIQRAKDNGAYIVVLIEATYSDVQSIEYLPQTKWIKASSDFLLKQARDLYLRYDNFQMVAGGTRTECIRLFNRIIKIQNIKIFDIQYLVDTNKI